MIELKRCNYITGDESSISFGLSRIIKFLELEGRNIVLLSRPKTLNTTSLKYLFDNKIEYNNYDEFKFNLEDKSNLFRLNLIIADLWHLNKLKINEYKLVLDETGIDYMIIAKEYSYKESDDIADYHIYSGSNDMNHRITNKIDGWTSDLDSIEKSYIRDKKIDGIIGEDFI